MRSKKILSVVLSTLMLSNMTLQSLPAGALDLLAAENKRAAEKSEASEENLTEVASGEPVFTVDSSPVALGENTISEACGKDTVWTYDLDSHILVISGTGAAVDLTYKSDKILEYGEEIETVIIESTITSMNTKLLQDCKAITKLVLPFAGLKADDDTAEIKLSQLFGSSVPETLETLEITGGTRVPDYFCWNVPSIKSIVLGDSITSIGNYAFGNDYSSEENYLESVKFPAALTSIGDYAFQNNGLLTEVEIPETIKTIGSYSFYGCNSLTEIKLSGVTSVGSYAFSNCAGLASVSLPSTVETIGEYAFANCGALTEARIANASNIGRYIFNDCSAVETLAVPCLKETADGTSINLGYMFYDVPSTITSLEITSGTVVPTGFCANLSSVTKVTIPATVTAIGDNAFSGCTGIKNIKLPNKLTKIGNNAFYQCEGLGAINIPGSVKTIGNSAFANCTGASAIVIGEGVESIGEGAFNGCSAAVSVGLPSTLKTISDYAFAEMTSLSELTIPEGTEKIGGSVLSGDTALAKLVLPFAGRTVESSESLSDLFYTIPESLTYLEVTGGTSIPDSYCCDVDSVEKVVLGEGITRIGSRSFGECDALADITFPESLVSAGANALGNSAWFESQDNGIVYAGGVALGYKGRVPESFELEFDDAAKGIADEAFYDYDNITSVSFPDGLISIGYRSFASCNGLTKIAIPDTVESVGSYAFESCYDLAKIDMSDNISHLGARPFYDTKWESNTKEGLVYIGKVLVGYKGEMPKKTTITVKDGTTEISDDAFKNYDNLVAVEFPDSLVSIGNNAFADCGHLTKVTIPDSVTTIGSGAFQACQQLSEVQLSSGITKIADSTFNNCVSLASVVIPENVKSIGSYAFYNTKLLKDVTLSDKVTDVYYNAFDYSFDKDDEAVERTLIIAEGSEKVTDVMVSALRGTLTEVKLPSTLKTIGANAFYDCDKITAVAIPEKTEFIGEKAFYDCDGITAIDIPSSVGTIGNEAFNSCDKLAKITLNEGLSSIGSNAFANAPLVKSVIIPDTVKAVSSGAFCNCSSLAEVKLSASLKRLNSSLFSGCSALTDVVVPYGVETIDSYVFDNCTSLKSITIPDTVTEFNSWSYYGIDPMNLEYKVSEGSKKITRAMIASVEDHIASITIPETVQSIEGSAFYGCDNITSVEIPATVKTIGDTAFYGCEKLEKVTLNEGLTTIGKQAFAENKKIKEITVPETVTAIGPEAFRSCSALKKVVLPSGLKTIENGTFAGCEKLQNTTLPKSLVTIGYDAFRGCSSITALDIPNSVKKIESHAFAYCNSLREIYVSGLLSDIYWDAFALDDGSLTSRTLIFKDNTEEITNDMLTAFRDNITAVMIPDSVNEIGESAFSGCSKLKEATVPESVTIMGNGVFSNCASLKELTLPDSITKLSKSICYNCTALEKVTLPSKLSKITDSAFYNCTSLSEVVSPVKDFRFRSTSFTNCVSLYDPRFMVLDKRNINLSANTDSIGVDGIVNFSLTYQLTPFLFEESVKPVLQVNLPEGMELVYTSISDEGNPDLTVFTKELTEESGTVKFAAKVREYGTHRVTASLTFTYDDEIWREGIGTVDVKTPLVTVSAPSNVNSKSLIVRGIAAPDQDVTIYVDGEKSTTVKSNEKTGKYAVEVELPKKESGEAYSISAKVGENTSNTVTVTYSPKKPMIEKVYLRYNGDHSGAQSYQDITAVFTEGKRPVISFNPAYPFEFEIKVSNPECVSDIYVISRKGDDTKSIKGYWDREKESFIAYGYFDPTNRSYVPGALNISVYTVENAKIDFLNDIMEGSDEILRPYIKETADMDNLKPSDLTSNIPANVVENSSADVVYHSDSSFIADVNISDGKDETALSIYANTSDVVYVNGEPVTAEEIYKHPEDYGFTKANMQTVDENGNTYDYYVRVPSCEDAAHQVYDDFASTGAYDGGTNSVSAEDVYRWRSAYGTQTLVAPASPSRPSTPSNPSSPSVPSTPQPVVQSTYAVPTLPEFKPAQDFSGYVYSPIEKVADSFTLKPGAIDPDTGLKIPDTPEAAARWAQEHPVLNKVEAVGKTVDYAFRALNTINDGIKTYNRFQRLNNIPNSGDLKFAAGAFAVAKIAYDVVGSAIITDMGAELGAAIGTAICPGVGTVIGGILGGLLANYLADKLFDSVEQLLDDAIAYAEDGYIGVLIDPSGFVFEAVKRNRVAGAKMTVYYKDPESGKEIEWNSEDFDQKNPLTTNEDGEYAWDVPEGLWRVKFEKDGYETQYSDWMDVPPIRTDVNFSVVSLEVPEIDSANVIDGNIVLTFTKFMDVTSVTNKSVTVKSGDKAVDCVVTPIITDDEPYTNTFVIQSAKGALPSGALTLAVTDNCRSYSAVAVKAQTTKVIVPDNIISIYADNSSILAPCGQETTIEITAKPASEAEGKKLVITKGADSVKVKKEVVFNEKGKAVITIIPVSTKMSEIAFAAEGSDLSVSISLISIKENEYKTMNAVTTTAAVTTTTTTTTAKPTTTTTTSTTTTTTTTAKPTTTTTTSTTTTTTTTSTTTTTTTTSTVVKTTLATTAVKTTAKPVVSTTEAKPTATTAIGKTTAKPVVSTTEAKPTATAAIGKTTTKPVVSTTIATTAQPTTTVSEQKGNYTVAMPAIPVLSQGEKYTFVASVDGLDNAKVGKIPAATTSWKSHFTTSWEAYDFGAEGKSSADITVTLEIAKDAEPGNYNLDLDGLVGLMTDTNGNVIGSDQIKLPKMRFTIKKAEEVSFTLCDLDGDNKISAADASAVLMIYSALSVGDKPDATEAQLKAADANEDGKIDASDASLILMFYSHQATGGTKDFVTFRKTEG